MTSSSEARSDFASTWVNLMIAVEARIRTSRYRRRTSRPANFRSISTHRGLDREDRQQESNDQTSGRPVENPPAQVGADNRTQSFLPSGDLKLRTEAAAAVAAANAGAGRSPRHAFRRGNHGCPMRTPAEGIMVPASSAARCRPVRARRRVLRAPAAGNAPRRRMILCDASDHGRLRAAA